MCASMCCPCCVLSQMYREIKNTMEWTSHHRDDHHDDDDCACYFHYLIFSINLYYIVVRGATTFSNLGGPIPWSMVLLPFYRKKLDRSTQFGAVGYISTVYSSSWGSVQILGRSGPSSGCTLDRSHQINWCRQEGHDKNTDKRTQTHVDRQTDRGFVYSRSLV